MTEGAVFLPIAEVPVVRSDYDTLTDAWSLIIDAYMKGCADRTEHGVSVLYDGYPTTDVLVKMWEDKEKAVEALCASHGWTVAELEDEIARRCNEKHPVESCEGCGKATTGKRCQDCIDASPWTN
jgi:hypothetical protein